MVLKVETLGMFFRKPKISPFYYELVDKILALDLKYRLMSNSDIKAHIELLKSRFNDHIYESELICESFAATREIASRKLGLKHFETQILGGLVLNDGKIAEMKTGEGKTLVATLPACYQALSGQGVHIVTVNDYLARRDKELLQPIYQSLGFKVGLIREGMEMLERQYNYSCDITYATNTEIGFDYLRDLMADSSKTKVLRSFNYCIIDEVDSVLIDEAQTPLILSTPKTITSDNYSKALWVSKQLIPKRHFTTKYRTKQVSLTQEGYSFLSEIFQTDDLYDPKNPWLAFVENSLRALLFYKKDQDYIIQNNQIQIIDKFTGRVAKDRKWSDGLHQAIECKENVKISSESQTLNSITYPKFFSLYKKLSGMTGTAKTSDQEFKEFYGLEVVVIPTKKPIKRKDFKDLIFETKKAKFKALIDNIILAYASGRPVLVGTTTIEDSEIVTETLKSLGLNDCQLLNAKPENSESEAGIVSQSGSLNAVTIATNMAGRGTDIILGGNLKYIVTDLLKQIVYELLSSSPLDINLILGFEKEDKLLLLLNDIKNLLIKFDPTKVVNYFEEITDIEASIPQTPLEKRIQELYAVLLTLCRNEWSTARNLVCELGGLLILGTSRHESRRIDNQLRGRAGRQGDPGESKFFISLEDDIVRRYDPNLFRPFIGQDNPDCFSGTDYIALNKTFDALQDRVEKFLYENRKSSSAFEEIYEYHQRLYFVFRECILEYDYPLNLLINISLYRFSSISDEANLYSINTKTGFSFQITQYIYISTILSSSLFILHNQIINRQFLSLCRKIILELVDQKWMEFGERISLSRDTIGLQAYAQKDPLIEYNRFCSQEFAELLKDTQSLLIQSLINFVELNKTYLAA